MPETDAEPLNAEINLNALYAALNAELQPCIDMVSFGLRAAVLGDVPDEPHTGTPGAKLDLHTGTPLPGGLLREQFCTWVLRGGIRDAFEVVSVFVEHARLQAAMIQLSTQYPAHAGGGVTIPAHEWNAVMVDEWQRFHRLGFPDKLDVMRHRFGRDLLPEITPKVRSINQARNCFVHRQGIVSDRDKNCEDGLRVAWTSMTPYLKDENGLHPLILRQRVETESRVVLQFGEEERVFQVGERLTFSIDDFTGICWTLVEFGRQFCVKLSEYGVETGCFQPEPLTETP